MSIYYLDLETTGLDPERDEILEIAIGKAEWDNPTKVERVYQAVLYLDPDWIPTFHPVVQEMHTKNGLFKECAVSNHQLYEQVEAEALSYIPKIDGGHTLAGNSVHFDLSFLKADMPRLAARFSHRLLDVSAVRLFARTLGFDPPKAEPAHRAWDDVLSSAAQLEELRRLMRGLPA